MKKIQIIMLSATLLGLAVLIFFELKDEPMSEHRPGTIEIQDRGVDIPQKSQNNSFINNDKERFIRFEEIKIALEQSSFPCDHLQITAKSDYEICISGQIETETIRHYLSEIDVGYNALLELLPDSSACVLDLGLGAENGTLRIWCTGAEFNDISLPEGMIPQIIFEKLSNALWPVDGMQQLQSVQVMDEGLLLCGTE